MLFLVSSQESAKASKSEFPAALRIGELFTGPPRSELMKRRDS